MKNNSGFLFVASFQLSLIDLSPCSSLFGKMLVRKMRVLQVENLVSKDCDVSQWDDVFLDLVKQACLEERSGSTAAITEVRKLANQITHN